MKADTYKYVEVRTSTLTLASADKKNVAYCAPVHRGLAAGFHSHNMQIMNKCVSVYSNSRQVLLVI